MMQTQRAKLIESFDFSFEDARRSEDPTCGVVVKTKQGLARVLTAPTIGGGKWRKPFFLHIIPASVPIPARFDVRAIDFPYVRLKFDSRSKIAFKRALNDGIADFESVAGN